VGLAPTGKRRLFTAHADLDHLGSRGQCDPTLPTREFASRIGDARVQLIDRAGHLPHIERPDEVARLVNGFLDD
jgi:pimeloyl-ACP methyl ester carboxylesterase